MALNLSKSYTPSSTQVANSTSYNTDIAALFNAFSGLEAQTSTLGGLTITPSSDSTTKLLVNNAAGTAQFAIDTTNSEIIDTSTLGIKSTYGLFHDRGDPTAYDFTLASGLVTNGTWQDLDLSSIVPAGAKTVALHVDITDDAASAYIYFRKKGNSNEKNISLLIAPVANIGSYADIIVPLSTARVVEYKTNNVTFTGINITVKGWWK